MENEQESEMAGRMRQHLRSGMPLDRAGLLDALYTAHPPKIRAMRTAGYIEIESDRVQLSKYLLQEPAAKAAAIYLELMFERTPLVGKERLFEENGIRRVPLPEWDLFRYECAETEIPATLRSRILDALNQVRNFRLTRQQERCMDVATGAFAVLFLQLILATPPGALTLFNTSTTQTEAQAQAVKECELAEMREAIIAGRPANREKCQEVAK